MNGTDGVCGYEVVTDDFTAVAGPGVQTTDTVECPVGKVAISGGYSFETVGSLAVRVSTVSADGQSWRVVVNNQQATTPDVSVTAVCIVSPELSLRYSS